MHLTKEGCKRPSTPLQALVPPSHQVTDRAYPADKVSLGHNTAAVNYSHERLT